MNKKSDTFSHHHHSSLLKDVICTIKQKKLNKKDTDNLINLTNYYFLHVSEEEATKFNVKDSMFQIDKMWSLVKGNKNNLQIDIFPWQKDLGSIKKDRLIINILNVDRQFLMDSFLHYLKNKGLKIKFIHHPVIKVKRDKKGCLQEIIPHNQNSEDYVAESLIHCEVSIKTDESLINTIKKDLAEIFEEVILVTCQWKEMSKAMLILSKELEIKSVAQEIDSIAFDESKSMLEWLYNNHYTFLGYGEYNVVSDKKSQKVSLCPKSALGLLKKDGFNNLEELFKGTTSMEMLDSHNFCSEYPVIISKTTKKSRVRRNITMDAVIIKKVDENNKITGFHLFTGLFTSEVYDSSVKDIPILRQKIKNVGKMAFPTEHSHDARALSHIFDNLPKDSIMQANDKKLMEIGLELIKVKKRQSIACIAVNDIFERFISCMVFIPNNRFDTALCDDIEKILEEKLNVDVFLVNLYFSKFDMIVVHFRTEFLNNKVIKIDTKDIEKSIVQLSQSWVDRLNYHLIQNYDDNKSEELFMIYKDSFSQRYKDDFSVTQADGDMFYFEQLRLHEREIVAQVYRSQDQASNRICLKVYRYGKPMPLSNIIPVLENLDLHVYREVPYDVTLNNGTKIWIHDFELISMDGYDLDHSEEARSNLVQALYSIWDDLAEDDGFNRLIIRSKMSWSQVCVIRAYCKYLRQTGVNFNSDYIEKILINNQNVTKLLFELFAIKFDITHPEKRPVSDKVKEIKEALNNIKNADEDLVLRRVLNLVTATMRTNFYQKDKGGKRKSYISFKFASAQIGHLPLPKPMFEIFVYAKYMESIHLRGGNVARGGIRWSDRPQDYRTEVLGLMKSQMVKNTVIIPVGSKGGFIVKESTEGLNHDEFVKVGIKCYQTMIKGMLDITDNLCSGKVIVPKDVVRHDGDDPYLVVAADKGTATFSDHSNAVSQEYDFWLDDAFASGGSVGYDHKKMGITAKGAWESVKHLFASIDHDTQKDSFTVAGVGDMSGDVFGNGMLLSKAIKLQFAFNHKHIFIDPEPDIAASYKERARLFKMPKSSWEDYDKKLISKGGGIFSRAAKTLNLSKEISTLLDIKEKEITPNELIKHILLAPVDLLWFGGIGTYIKSQHEPESEVGDRANAAVRINASDMKCKVIGEGANLGVTQRGRIEFNQKGGLINTDFIDNSAGVDCSDHEVNIKILLSDLVRRKKLTLPARNQMLEKMTNNVEDLVLQDNIAQNKIISFIESLGGKVLDHHSNLMKSLEQNGRLNRAIEFLPDERKIDEYSASGRGMSRPEISVLLSYAKMEVYDQLLRSNLITDPIFHDKLQNYFPDQIKAKYPKEITNHPLRKEIIATSITNEVINKMGPSFINNLRIKTGKSIQDIICAFYMTHQIYKFNDIWQAIANMPGSNGTIIQKDLWQAIRKATSWLLNYHHDFNKVQVDKVFQQQIGMLEQNILASLGEQASQNLSSREEKYLSLGLDKKNAQTLVMINLLTSSPDIVLVAQKTKFPIKEVASVYFNLGEKFSFDSLRHMIATLESNSSINRMAVNGIVEDLYYYQARLSNLVISYGKERNQKFSDNGNNFILNWNSDHQDQVDQINNLIASVKSRGQIDFETLIVLSRYMRILTS